MSLPLLFSAFSPFYLAFFAGARGTLLFNNSRGFRSFYGRVYSVALKRESVPIDLWMLLFFCGLVFVRCRFGAVMEESS